MRVEKKNAKSQDLVRGNQITVTINNKPVIAYEGELVSTVLYEEGIQIFQIKHKTGNPSGIYCGMGICYECLVTINGVPNTRACQTPVVEGMAIETGNQEVS